jgi:hypothetical protein
MSTTHSDTDTTLMRKFVNLAHDRAVGGAVNSDDSDDDRAIDSLCAEKDPASDTAGDCTASLAPGNPVCTCGECDRKHYVNLLASRPEVSGSAFTTFPCHLPMDKVVFVPNIKPNQKNPIFHVKYSGPIDYNIRLVLEHPDFSIVSYENRLPGKEEPDTTVVCKLQLADAGGPFSVNIYQKYEAESFIKALGQLSDEYYSFLHKTYPDFTFEMANVLSTNGGLNIAVDTFKRAGKPGGSKTADIVAQYLAVDSSKKLMCIRIGFAWMFPNEEDATHRSFRAGIKYYLVEPRKKLMSGLKPPARPSTSWTLPPDGDS